MDDCSSDDSLEILRLYRSNPQVSHFIVNEHNSGSPFKQWKKGIDLAQGDFIWIAESDDWADERFLEECLSEITKDEKIGMVSHESYKVNAQNEIIGSTEYQFATPVIREAGQAKRYNGIHFLIDNMLYRSGIYNASGVLFRKTACRGFSAYAELKQAGDTLFWTNILTQYDIVVNYEKLNYFRQHESSVTSRNYTRNLIPMFEMYERIEFSKTRIPINAGALEFAYQKAFNRTIDHIIKLDRQVLSPRQLRIYSKLRRQDKKIFLRLVVYYLDMPISFISSIVHNLIKMIKGLIWRILHANWTKKMFQKVFFRIGYQIDELKSHQTLAGSDQGLNGHPVDESELAELNAQLVKFSRLYPNCIGKEAKGDVNWSDPAVVRGYLQDWRIALFHEVIRKMEQHGVKIDQKHVLELGSGTGYLIRLLQRKYAPATITGYDTYQALNQLAQFLCPGASFENKDLFSQFGNHYDLIICMETLEHLKEPGLAINNMLKYLNRPGCIFLTVPNGRIDTMPSVGVFPNEKGYWGHINFWSIESWGIFLRKTISPDFDIQTGEISNGKILYALIAMNK